MQTTILDKVPGRYTYASGRRRLAGTATCSYRGANCESTPKPGQRYCKRCHNEYMSDWRATKREQNEADRRELAELRALVGR